MSIRSILKTTYTSIVVQKTTSWTPVPRSRLWSLSKAGSSCFQETLGKIESNLQDSTQTEGHVKLSYTTMSSIWLNASVLSDSHSLFVFLTSPLILSQDQLNKIPFWALINSGSTHYFVNLKFVDTYQLKISATPPVTFHLFDGSLNSNISKIANLPIIFPTS